MAAFEAGCGVENEGGLHTYILLFTSCLHALKVRQESLTHRLGLSRLLYFANALGLVHWPPSYHSEHADTCGY